LILFKSYIALAMLISKVILYIINLKKVNALKNIYLSINYN